MIGEYLGLLRGVDSIEEEAGFTYLRVGGRRWLRRIVVWRW